MASSAVKIGSMVVHTQEPELGTGRVVALSRARNIVLVLWGFPQERNQGYHDLRVVKLAK